MLVDGDIAKLTFDELERLIAYRKAAAREKLYLLHFDRENIDGKLQDLFEAHISIKGLARYMVERQGVDFFSSGNWQLYADDFDYYFKWYQEDEEYFVRKITEIKCLVLGTTAKPNVLDPRPIPKSPRELSKMDPVDRLEYELHYHDEKYWRQFKHPLVNLYKDVEDVMVNIYRLVNKLTIAELLIRASTT